MINLLEPFRALRLRRALRDYLPVSLPHQDHESELTIDNAIENYEFFLTAKEERITSMQAWFERHFDIDISLTDKGMRQFSRWIDRYGMLVLAPFRDHFVAWDTYRPAWSGEYASLNLVYDTAILYGEYIITCYPVLYWSFFDKLPPVPGLRRESFYRPTLGGLTSERQVDPLKFAFDLYRHAASERALFRRDVKNRLLRRINFAFDSAAKHAQTQATLNAHAPMMARCGYTA